MGRLLLDSQGASALTQSKSDAITASDGQALSLTKVLSDTATVGDSISTSAGLHQALADSITPSDSRTKSISKVLSDSTSPIDSQVKTLSKALMDSTSLGDVVSPVPVKTLADSVTPSDVLTRVGISLKSLSDSISPLDSFSRTIVTFLNLSDGITTSDSIDTGGLKASVPNRDDLSGPVTGGKLIAIVAPGIDMASIESTFASGTIDSALWSTTVSGSGTVKALPGAQRGALQLSTGQGASSIAYLRSVGTSDRSDAQTDFTIGSIVLRSGVALATVSLGIYVGSTTFLRATVEISRSLPRLHVQAVENGIVLQDVVLPIVSIRKFRLRVLRDQERFFVFLNDALVLSSTWTTTAGLIEMGVTNDSLGQASVSAAMTQYVRNPVILFGSEPMKTVLMETPNRVDGLAPPQTAPGPQPITIYTATDVFAVDTPYDYTPVFSYRQVGLVGPIMVTDVSDNSVLQSG